jgi:hypothetical protein
LSDAAQETVDKAQSLADVANWFHSPFHRQD